MILCAPNNGAIPTLGDDDVVEITCDVNAEAAFRTTSPLMRFLLGTLNSSVA